MQTVSNQEMQNKKKNKKIKTTREIEKIWNFQRALH